MDNRLWKAKAMVVREMDLKDPKNRTAGVDRFLGYINGMSDDPIHGYYMSGKDFKDEFGVTPESYLFG